MKTQVILFALFLLKEKNLMDKALELSQSIKSNKTISFRVLAQIILSVFSLNAKEDGALNEVGKIEAHRAGHAYILNWIEQSKEN